MIWTTDLFSRVAALACADCPHARSCVLVVRGDEPEPTCVPIPLSPVGGDAVDRCRVFADLGEFSRMIKPCATRASLVVRVADPAVDPVVIPVPVALPCLSPAPSS